MPFIALQDGKRIDITRVDNPRSTIVKEGLVCQLCYGSLFIKAGQIITPHFCHYADCTSDFEHKPESTEHRLGKQRVATMLRKEIDDTGVHVELEVPIPEIKRVVDVLVTYAAGWRTAHEIQLSSITTGTLEERTNDYYREGIACIWYLGKGANTETNRQWCLQKTGEYWTLVFDHSLETQEL